MLMVSAALAVLVLGGAWALAESQHHLSPVSLPRNPAPVCTGINLTTVSDVQVAIDHAPPGSTFCFRRASTDIVP